MLEEQDLKKIGEEVGKVIEDNITPALDRINERLDSVEGRLTSVEGRLTSVEGRLTSVQASMVTKSYLDDKLADLEGSTVIRQRKGDQKINLLIEFLKNKQVLGESEVRQLKEFQVFPAPPAIA